MLERCLLFDDLFPLDAEGNRLEDILIRLRHRSRLRLERDAVLPWPWNPHRLRGAMAGLGPGGDWGEWKSDSNHQVVLWEPIRIGWVHGGNHSMAVGILLGRGTVLPQEVYDISPLYKLVTCDGSMYRRTHDRAIISEVASVEMAAIFEIGRLLIEQTQKPAKLDTAPSKSNRRTRPTDQRT
jgi:hypothetical protein